MPQSIGEQLDELGWQAGAVIPAQLLPQFAAHLSRPGQSPAEVQDADWLVVVSQTCDVVQFRLENEPFVEVLHCRAEEQLRPEFQGRKSTRRLDFRPNKAQHPDTILSAHAVADRYLVPRELLAGTAPDPHRQLSATAIANLQLWYALRYSRPAWPDAFNARFDKRAKKRLEAALKIIATDEVEVRVAIAEDAELKPDQPYHLAVYFVVDQQAWDSEPEVREQASNAFAAFTAALSACQGVVVNLDLSDVNSGDAFSWQLTRNTDEWNFANLSEQE